MKTVGDLLRGLAARGILHLAAGLLVVWYVGKKLYYMASRRVGHVLDAGEAMFLMLISALAFALVGAVAFSVLELVARFVARRLKRAWARRVVELPPFAVVQDPSLSRNVFQQAVAVQLVRVLRENSYELNMLDEADFQVVGKSALRSVLANGGLIQQSLAGPAFRAWKAEGGSGSLSSWIEDQKAVRKRKPFWLLVVFVKVVFTFNMLLKEYSPWASPPVVTPEVFGRFVQRSPAAWGFLAENLPPLMAAPQRKELPAPVVTHEAEEVASADMLEPNVPLELDGQDSPAAPTVSELWAAAMEDSPGWEEPLGHLDQLGLDVETADDDEAPELLQKLELMKGRLPQVEDEYVAEVEEGEGDMGSLRFPFVQAGQLYLEAGMTNPNELKRNCIRLRLLELAASKETEVAA